MTNFLNKQLVGKLNKDVQETAKFMTDMETFFRTQWKNGNGPTLGAQEYIDQKKLETLITGYQKMADLMAVLVTNQQQVTANQAKQSIDMVKAVRKQKSMQTEEPVVIPRVIEVPETKGGDNRAIIQAYVDKNGLIDPEKYARGKHIAWNTPGLMALEIAFNEFDLAILHDEDFNLFDPKHIKERWGTLFLHSKTLIGVPLSQVVKTYSLQRGLIYIAKKRGPKSTK